MSPVAHGSVTAWEANAISAAAGWLPTYVSAGSKFRQLCRETSRSASPARALMDLGAGFETADGQAALRGVAADDFLLGTGQLLGSRGLTNYSLYAVVRGAFEANAMICWLLEPGLPAKTHAARMLALRLHHQRLNAKYKPFMDHAAKRRGETVKQAQELNLTVDGDKVGEERVPGKTALAKLLLPDLGDETEAELGDILYHLLSGMSHSEEWGSLMGASAEPADPEVSNVGIDLNIRNFLLTLLHVLELHERAICCYGTHYGVDTASRPRIIQVPWVIDIVRTYGQQLPPASTT